MKATTWACNSRGLFGQRAGQVQHLPRSGSGIVGDLLDIGDVGRYFLRSAGRLLDAADDLGRGGALLFHRRRYAGRHLVDVGDRVADAPDRLDRFGGGGADVGDLAGDMIGRRRGLVRQALHFLSHHGEALAGIAGARRFDGRVSASRLVLEAISVIIVSTCPISCAATVRPVTREVVSSVTFTA